MKRIRTWVVYFLLTVQLLPAQGTGSVSYKIDGKSFSFQDAVLRYHGGDGYLSLDCERAELVDNPSRPGGKQELHVSLTIQLAGDAQSFVGTHEASSPDEMPVYFGWYELVPGKDKKQPIVLREYLASLDSGDQSKMHMRLKIDNFGPTGALVRGSFSGKLFDAEGQLHVITDGLFAVPRSDG